SSSIGPRLRRTRKSGAWALCLSDALRDVRRVWQEGEVGRGDRDLQFPRSGTQPMPASYGTRLRRAAIRKVPTVAGTTGKRKWQNGERTATFYLRTTGKRRTRTRTTKAGLAWRERSFG